MVSKPPGWMSLSALLSHQMRSGSSNFSRADLRSLIVNLMVFSEAMPAASVTLTLSQNLPACSTFSYQSTPVILSNQCLPCGRQVSIISQRYGGMQTWNFDFSLPDFAPL